MYPMREITVLRFFIPVVMVFIPFCVAIADDKASVSKTPTFDWSGPYAGVFVSHNWGKLDTQGDTSHLSSDEDDVWASGLFGGYRWNLPRQFVLGAQIEVPLAADTGTVEDITFYPAPAFQPPVTYEYDVDNVFLAIVQLGIAYDRLLPYVEAGIGRAEVSYRINNVDYANAYSPGAAQKTSNVHTIWKVGLGLDYAVTDNWIAGVKLSYFKAEPESYNLPWYDDTPGRYDRGAHGSSANFTLSYKF